MIDYGQCASDANAALQACVAAIGEYPLEDVPCGPTNFEVEEWLWTLPVCVVINYHNKNTAMPEGKNVIAVQYAVEQSKGARPELTYVVMRDGEIVYDPMPWSKPPARSPVSWLDMSEVAP